MKFRKLVKGIILAAMLIFTSLTILSGALLFLNQDWFNYSEMIIYIYCSPLSVLSYFCFVAYKMVVANKSILFVLPNSLLLLLLYFLSLIIFEDGLHLNYSTYFVIAYPLIVICVVVEVALTIRKYNRNL